MRTTGQTALPGDQAVSPPGVIGLTATVGRAATAAHLLLTLALAAPAAVILLFIASEAAFGDPESLWILALIFTLPISILGSVALVEALSVLRGRPVSRQRVLLFASASIAGGILLARDLFTILGAVMERPGDVAVGWPVVLISSPDHLGTDYHYLNDPALLVALLWFAVGTGSLVALLFDLGQGWRKAAGRRNEARRSRVASS